MAVLLNDMGGELGFGEYFVERNDDQYTDGVDLETVFGANGFNFFGNAYRYVSINNNGNITFSNSEYGGLSTFTPFGLQEGGYAIIAPFFADVDTRSYSSPIVTPGGNSRGSNLTWYDIDSSGYGALTVTWDDVGYYSYAVDKLNAFQLRLAGRADGGFDVTFRYEEVNWTTGNASGGSGGLGGTVARAGFSTGDGSTWYELPQSGDQSAMLALDETLGNTGNTGEYRFSILGATSGSGSVQGTAGDDILGGSEKNDTLSGGAGNDYLYGGSGKDKLVGGQGDDIYAVDLILKGKKLLLEDSVLEGKGAGNDSLQLLWDDYAALAKVTLLKLGATLENFDASRIGTIDIDLLGNNEANRIWGNDFRNLLNGGKGNDQLYGLDGDDILIGGAGADSVTGGLGADIFRFASLKDLGLADGTVDVVTDFSSAEGDQLDFSALKGYRFVGSAEFDARKQLRIEADGADLMLYGNSKGDTAADFAIRLIGVNALDADDLML